MIMCKRKWTVLALATALVFSAVLPCSAVRTASAKSAQNGKKTLHSTKQAITSVIRARRIEIVDRSGKVCMRLSGDPWPKVELLDTAGKEAVCIEALGGLFSVVSVGDNRSSLSLMSNGLTLWNNGAQCATLELSKDGKPSLTLWYPNGKSAATLRLTKDGLPRILAWNKDGSACNPGIFGAASGASLFTPSLPTPPPSLSVPRSPGRTASGIYVGTGSGHWVSSVSNDGRLVTLEDDSVWEISPLDRIDTQLWLATTDITVVDGKEPGYPYTLINKDDSETAEAKLLSD